MSSEMKRDSVGLTVVTSNIDQAKREEPTDFCWTNRCEAMHALLIASSLGVDAADVIVVQEMRNLTTSKFKLGHTFGELSDKLGGEPGTFVGIPFYYNESKYPFAGCIFYRRNRLRLLFVRHVRYGGPEEACVRTLQFATFLDLKTDEEVTVVNIHFPMGEEDKWTAIRALKDTINTHHSRVYDRVLAIGDWNFFDDLQGKAMRSEMTSFFDEDHVQPLHVKEKTETGSVDRKMYGTFIGFPHDNFHSDMTPDETGDRYGKMSRLDHAFGRGFDSTPAGGEVLLPEGANTIDHSTYPTDHCAIRVNLRY